MSTTPKKQTQAVADTPKRITRATSRLQQLTLETPEGDVKDEPPVEKPAEEGPASDTDSTGSEPGSAGLDKQQGGINPPAAALAAEKMCPKCEELQRTAALLEETNGRQQQELEQLQEQLEQLQEQLVRQEVQLERQQVQLERKEERIKRQQAQLEAWEEQEEAREQVRAALVASAQNVVGTLDYEKERALDLEADAEELVDSYKSSNQLIADASKAYEDDNLAHAVQGQRERLNRFAGAALDLRWATMTRRAHIRDLVSLVKELLPSSLAVPSSS